MAGAERGAPWPVAGEKNWAFYAVNFENYKPHTHTSAFAICCYNNAERERERQSAGCDRVRDPRRPLPLHLHTHIPHTT